MIYVTCGTCGTSQGYKTKNDGALTLPAAEEKRLVARGVAEYVTRPMIGPINGTNSIPPDEATPGFPSPFAEQLDIIDGHFTRESLLNLTRQQMEVLALALDVDVSRCKGKGDIADLLVEVEAATPAEDSGEVLPELGVEEPVV